MKTYKNFAGTKEEYIAHLIERVSFWAKAFAEETDHRVAMCAALEDAEQALVNEGYDWDEIKAIEIAAMKAA